ncbi:MAG: DNA primase [Candidatus Pacebacteria bacterium]|nr:DNA primase [Candidatus Paceibacterota bacterium]
MPSPVEQIKERLGIVDVVSVYVKLQKAGKNYKGLSPFSNEKTPSFYVSPERDMYYCFSTNQGGDVFTFVEKMEGVDFAGALKILAERAGVELVHESKEVRDKRTRLYDILEKASAFYTHTLKRSDAASAYVASRGISDKSIAHFGIGFAQNEWRTLYDHLKQSGYSEDDLIAAGLLKRAEATDGTRYYDTFRGRIMFPIRDSAGRTIGFSGRILPEYDDGKTGKYINSPETELFNKSKALFGYDLAKGGIKKFNFSVLVEGQMDVVLSHQAGYTNTVAVSGTALTSEQLTLLGRLSKNIVMAFDADRAGVASAGRGATLALARGMDVKVARLPEGVDPADAILKDPEMWKVAIREATHIVDFYLTLLRESKGDNERKFRLAVHETVLPFVAQIHNKIDQTYFLQKVARELGVSEEIVREEMARSLNDATGLPATTQDQETKTETPRRETAEEKLLQIIMWQESLAEPQIDLAGLKEKFQEVVGEDRFKELKSATEATRQQQIFKTELLYDDSHQLKEDIEELLHHLTYRTTKRELEETTRELREAESSGDVEASSRLLEKIQEIANKLKSFIGKKY